MTSPATLKWQMQRGAVCLRLAALLVNLAAVISFAWSQERHDMGEVLSSDLGHHTVTPATGTTEYACIWALIIFCMELSTPVTFHPGFYIFFDLAAWVSVLIGVIWFLLFMNPYYSGDGYQCGRDYKECNGKLVADVEMFASAMALLGVVIHFGFFVWVCRATDKRRKSEQLARKGGGADGDAFGGLKV
ncbi:hypothetical protein BDV18DRAFT_40521 [Aspergillus unguis]